MTVHGSEFLAEERRKPGFFIKAVMNDAGIKFFSGARQHRDTKVPGISYEDDYRGNALAVIVQPGKVEIRFHKDFSDDHAARLWREVAGSSEGEFTRGWRVTYQGREINV